MQRSLEKFLEKLPLKKSSHHFFQGGEIEKVVYQKNQASITISLVLKRNLPLQLYLDLKNHALNYFMVEDVVFSIKTTQPYYQYLDDYIDYYYRSHQSDLGITIPLTKINKNQVACLFTDAASLELAEEASKELEEYLKLVGYLELSINFELYHDTFDYNEVKVKLNENNGNGQLPKLKNNYPVKRAFQAVKSLDLITEEIERIVITGKIFKIDKIENRINGNLIVTIFIFDENSAFILKLFEGRRFSKEMLEALEEGLSIRAYGNVEYDRYSRDLVLKAEKIETITDLFLVSDNAHKKRVELHAHTNKSEMDGINSASALVNYAYNLGHRAVAITDHNVIQAFPEAQHAANRLNRQNPNQTIKVIYGVEFNLVDDGMKLVFNADDSLIDDEFVIFDLETTGLSVMFDEIIEFGAIKVKQGLVVESRQYFIKPKQNLSNFIISKTGINESDLSQAPELSEVITLIKEFLGDLPLVAHNAEFDIGFINEALVKHGFSKLKNKVIDTLNLSRTIHPYRRNHALGYVARFYGINYDESSAHRADYDAEVLTNVFLNLMEEVYKKDCKTYRDIQNLVDETAIMKTIPRHVTVLAKNSQGLKDLFKLVTLAHTEYLATTAKVDDASEITSANPLIFKSVLSKYRENLLMGSACFNGEVFNAALYRSLDDLNEAIKFYDYIEVQPLSNYSPLLVREVLKSEADLKTVISQVISAAQKENKMVVATSDSHYLGEEDKVLRDVYILAQGVGGVRHPLYYRDERLRKETKAPDQHFRSTEMMLAEFDYLDRDLAYEIVVTNPNLIADEIAELSPIKEELYTPFIKDADQKLIEICYHNARQRYGENLPQVVADRLELELGKIIEHGFAVIYYIAHLLVKESLDHGYIVGSRGSVGSSLVATMADITEVNPLPPHYYCQSCHYQEFFTNGEVASGYDLVDKPCPHCQKTMVCEGQDIPFETFLGFEGDKVPDIDLNFSSDFQERAHNFTKTIFGQENVYRAGTIGTVALKSAYGYVSNYIEELDLGHLKEAFRQRLAQGSSGVKRTTGQHPGGIIVIPKEMDVYDFTPVQYPANNPNSEWLTTHFEFADLHDNLLKLDILGHVDPTAMKLLERISGIDVKTIPMNDPKVMALFNSLDSLNIDSRTYQEKTGAVGLPEFGTTFVRSILELTKPTSFSDLVRISGLSHGTDVWLNNAKLFVEKGLPLSKVIGCRDDIMTDLIKQGLDPKDAFDIMESVRKGKGLTPKWIKLMKDHQVEDWYIDSCQRIKYMFPKAHAVAYVIMAIRVAWFKVYHPAYYYISFFTLRADAFDIEAMIGGQHLIEMRLNDINQRLSNFKTANSDVTQKERDIVVTLEVALEMYLRGYRFSNISLEKSLATEFLIDPNDDKVLIPPFSTVDGLGVNAARSLVEARKNLPFISKEDILKRTLLSSTVLNKLEQMNVLGKLQEENQLSLF